MSLPAVLEIAPAALNITISVGGENSTFSTKTPIQLVNTAKIQDILTAVTDEDDENAITKAIAELQKVGVELTETNLNLKNRASLLAEVNNNKLNIKDTSNAFRGGAPQLGGKKTRKHAAKKSHKKHKKHNATRHKKDRKSKSHK